MTIDARISKLVSLGKILENALLDETIIHQAIAENPWFTRQSIEMSIQAVVHNYLNHTRLQEWVAHYPISERPTDKKVGLILAGNIPLVGIHDVLSCYMSGHTGLVKVSSKDRVLMQLVVDALGDRVQVVERLQGFDAVIATGSNNTSRYFHQYFGAYPHIIRKNRHGVGILTGDESREEIVDLGKDIFTFFGLGCRNVSKVYVPDDYDMTFLLEVLHDAYNSLAHHNKYKNNFDYNVAILLLNKETYLNNGCLIVRESKSIASSISVLHYERYRDIEQVKEDIHSQKDAIQCIVSHTTIEGLKTFALGHAQSPGLMDYADGVDTMTFLTSEVGV